MEQLTVFESQLLSLGILCNGLGRHKRVFVKMGSVKTKGKEEKFFTCPKCYRVFPWSQQKEERLYIEMHPSEETEVKSGIDIVR